MSVSIHDIDWQELSETQHAGASTTDSRRRLRWLFLCYGLLLAVVWSRAVQLELSAGDAFRRVAEAPLRTQLVLEAERGRILARDGQILAADRQAYGLAVQYRYLERPLNKDWLKRRARQRLTRAERRDPATVVAAADELRDEILSTQNRLAALCGVSPEQWQRRTARIQRRVEQVAEVVNRRRRARFVEQTSTVPVEEPLSIGNVLRGLFSPPEQLPPSEIAVAEQVAYHRVVDELPAEVADAVRSEPAAFPGVRVVSYIRRQYPRGDLAANVIGHVGAGSSAEATVVAEKDALAVPAAGLAGIEAKFEARLAGQPGAAIELTNRRGELLATEIQRRPAIGRDLVLTLDAELQRYAEQLLDRHARRRSLEGISDAGSGAVLLMDVHSGEMLSAASQPRFDPNWFAAGDARVEAVLADPARPLFDRATRMAIPPGSVFKPLVAMALLEHGVVRPQTTFACQGYLDSSDHLRCLLFRQHGIGHGSITLADALAQSCNVYFSHHAALLGPRPLVAWTRRLGFGETGHVPTPDELQRPDALGALAIGQGELTATPLEVLRLYAAIANGGHLVEPTFVRSSVASRRGLDESTTGSNGGTAIPGLDAATLAAIRAGLVAVVEDPAGTAFDTVRIEGVPIAGKTGTAETGGGQADHAWFAGYVPADAPRFALVVALEHGGSGSTAAGTITRHLVERLRQLGYLPHASTAARPLPPGKG